MFKNIPTSACFLGLVPIVLSLVGCDSSKVAVLETREPAVQSAVFTNDFPECKTEQFQRLLAIDHAAGDFQELIDNAALIERCTRPIESPSPSIGAALPTDGLVNYETAHVHPLDITPDKTRLLSVNTAANVLEVWNIADGQIDHLHSIPVGLDPVTVRVRSNTEAWVVNNVSDSISVIDLVNASVIRTIQTENEPSDVVFADAHNRAFVSCAEPNKVLVYQTSDLDQAPTSIDLNAEEPRAMAISADGSRVYVAAFESGNATTALNGRRRINQTGGELGSDRILDAAAPNQGTGFSPPLLQPAIDHVSLIVRKSPAGSWLDDNGVDWSRFISGAESERTRRVQGWDLPDRDVAIIDANSLAVSYQTGLMNILMAIAVNPDDGTVTAVGTDASNEIRFEPNLNGTFVQVKRASFQDGGTADVSDINPHLTYQVATIPAAQREASIGDPRGIVWNAAGDRAWITGMGSNNVIVVDRDFNRVNRFDVGEGPTGIVIDEDADRGFVLNKFAGSISVFSLSGGQELSQQTYYDPTPESIKAGRPFLYDTHLSSGLGQASCASCHVDAKTDRLAWDLGNPSGTQDGVHSPMKSAMLTQSLQDVMDFPNLHWRGDRANLSEFNPTFTNLMGADRLLSADEMDRFGRFLGTIHFTPNPYRHIDNSLPSSLVLPSNPLAVTGNPQVGRSRLNGCLGCHLNGQKRSARTSFELNQNVIPPAFHGFYKRVGYLHRSAAESTSGFGFMHDGVDPLLGAARSVDLLAAIMTFDGPENGLSSSQSRLDVHAGVGQQVTINALSGANENARLNQLIDISNNRHVELIAKLTGQGQAAKGYLRTSGGAFQTDAGSQTISLTELLSTVDANTSLTFTLVPTGTGTRFGIDRNFNGINDGDEAAFQNMTSRVLPMYGYGEQFTRPTSGAFRSGNASGFEITADATEVNWLDDDAFIDGDPTNEVSSDSTQFVVIGGESRSAYSDFNVDYVDQFDTRYTFNVIDVDINNDGSVGGDPENGRFLVKTAGPTPPTGAVMTLVAGSLVQSETVAYSDDEEEPDPEPNPDPDPDNGSELLVNGNFESQLSGWLSCGNDSNIEFDTTNTADGNGAVRLSNGGCLYQELSVQIDDEHELNCSADRVGNAWTIMEMNYLDRNYQLLATHVKQISANTGYASYSASGTAPAGTSFVEVLLYSEDVTSFDACSLVRLGGGDTTTTPEVDPNNSLLTNGDFENGISAWDFCAADALVNGSADADSGASAMEVKQGGCSYQEFAVESGRTYKLSCRAKSESNQFYTSISLNHMDGSFTTLESAVVPVETQSFRTYTTQLQAPANSEIGSVLIYSDDIGVFDNCVVTEAE